jgi:hypothetical protein
MASHNGRKIKLYRGCSRISDYEVLAKLGEGTFGYVEAYEFGMRASSLWLINWQQ